MIVQFFNRGIGSGSSPVNYLLGKERERVGASVLRGDADVTIALIDGSPYAKKYTSGCLSFEEENLTAEQKSQIMDSFEKTIFAGLEGDQYNCLWVEHRDKGRLELNFLIPNVELTTGKRLQPYFHGADLPRVNAWRTIVNLKMGLSDPDDPIKQQNLVLAKDLPPNKKEALEAITDGLVSMAKQGFVKNRQDVINALEASGFEIARETKTSISIKNPEGGQNLRLKGAIYEQTYGISASVQETIRERSREHKNQSTERLEQAERIYKTGIERKRAEHSRKYQREQPTYSKNGIQELANTINSSISHSHNHGSSLVVAGLGAERDESGDKKRTADVEYPERANRGDYGKHVRSGRSETPLRPDESGFSETDMGERGQNIYDFTGRKIDDERDRTGIIGYLEKIGRESDERRERHSKRLGKFNQATERVGSLARAGYAIERSCRAVKQLIANAHEYVKTLKNERQKREKGFRMGR